MASVFERYINYRRERKHIRDTLKLDSDRFQ